MRGQADAVAPPVDSHMSGTSSNSLQQRGLGAVLLVLGTLMLSGPCRAAAPVSAVAAPAAPAAASAQPRRAAPIDINSASLAHLKTLPGIGDAEARRIIAHRPYLSKADLVTKNVIPAGVYQSNRHRIIAVQPGTPRPSKHP